MLWFVLLADYIVLVWWHACMLVCIHAYIAFAKEKVGSYFSNSVEKQEWAKSTRTQIDVHARYSKDTPREGSTEKLESLSTRRFWVTDLCMYLYLINLSPLGFLRANGINHWNKLNKLRIPTGRRQTSWLCTSAAEELNQVLPGTNPAGGQSGTWTRDLPISSPAP